MHFSRNIQKIVLILSVIIVVNSAAPQLSFHSSEASDTVFDNELLHFPAASMNSDWNNHVRIPQEFPKISFGFATRKTIKRIRFPDESSVPGLSISRKNELCQTVPEEKLQQKLFYDSNSGKCFPLGSKEPCNNVPNMSFARDELDNNNVLGKCICNPDPNIETPLVYHEGSDRCFALFTQANCAPDQWLIYDEEHHTPVCDVNPCISALSFRSGMRNTNSHENGVLFFNGACVAAHGVRASCPQGRVVGFVGGDLTPSCTLEHTYYATGAIGGVRKKCPKGLVTSFSGKCLRSFVW